MTAARADLARIDRQRLAHLTDRERATYQARHPRSRDAFAVAGQHLLGGVPMTWMRMWPGGFPLYLAGAPAPASPTSTATSYIDFCLGDTGAMAGHSPGRRSGRPWPALRRLGGATTMLPTADAEWVAAELTRRFGLPAGASR